MNNTNLIKALKKFATADLARARKEGRLAVAQTKLGTLEIQYIADLKKYWIVDSTGTVISSAKAKG